MHLRFEVTLNQDDTLNEALLDATLRDPGSGIYHPSAAVRSMCGAAADTGIDAALAGWPMSTTNPLRYQINSVLVCWEAAPS
jgi:hypothetical protein